jgi:hypothetical protein
MNIGHVDQKDMALRNRTDMFFAARPVLYIAIILGVLVAAYCYKLRTEGIFSCQANGYGTNWYLAYCNAAGYGDYEHGAVYFGLEPLERDLASNADVLFLGNSRMQIAFSTVAAADWFESATARYYLMGFGSTENAVFVGELLRKFKPRAKVYVINIDQFFVRTETMPAGTVMREPTAVVRYYVKRLWQMLHEPICRGLPQVCGSQYAVFRSRETGAYRTRGNVSLSKSHAVSYDESIDPAAAENDLAIGREFLSRLPVKHECVILTMVPFVGTGIGTANVVASDLGTNLVVPELDGLLTFDGSHLDHASAERWSKAFLHAAAPRIRKCLGVSQQSHP